MKATFSEYLNEIAPAMKELIAVLNEHYDYVSVLSSDSVGFTAAISQYAKSVSNSTIATERGNVVRVYKDGLYSEYAFNCFDTNKISGLCEEIMQALDSQLELLKETGVKVFRHPCFRMNRLQFLRKWKQDPCRKTRVLKNLWKNLLPSVMKW